MNEQFDLEQVYDEKIYPLMNQILEICKEHNMPMLATFVYGATGEGDDREQFFCTSVLNDRLEGRHCKEISAALDIIRNGLPENRLMAFTVTSDANLRGRG